MNVETVAAALAHEDPTWSGGAIEARHRHIAQVAIGALQLTEEHHVGQMGDRDERHLHRLVSPWVEVTS